MSEEKGLTSGEKGLTSEGKGFTSVEKGLTSVEEEEDEFKMLDVPLSPPRVLEYVSKREISPEPRCGEP